MSDDCAQCRVLRLRIGELEEELAIWRAGGGGGSDQGAVLERLDRWQRRLKLAPGPARMLIALVDAAPRPVDPDALAEVTSPGREILDIEEPRNLVRKYVWTIRSALKAAGRTPGVRSVWGHGYAIDAQESAALRAAMGDAA